MASPQIFEDLSSVFSILLQKKSEHTFLYYPLFQDYLNLLTLVKLRIEYEKEAAKHIGKMDRPTKQRLKIAIEKLPAGDVKKLQGIKDDYRLRVGDLRVIFSVINDTIIIKDVLPRGQVYKRL